MCCRVATIVQTQCRTRLDLLPCSERTDDVPGDRLRNIAEGKKGAAMVELPPVDSGMMRKVLQNTCPSHSNIGLEDYARFTEKFGQDS